MLTVRVFPDQVKSNIWMHDAYTPAGLRSEGNGK